MLFLLFSPNILANRKFINKARDRIKIGFKSSYEIKKNMVFCVFFLVTLSSLDFMTVRHYSTIPAKSLVCVVSTRYIVPINFFQTIYRIFTQVNL